ncbi:MATE family efflux transporter [Janibacter sp. G56]|uniref:MATE family efflux transporter n=1 Tax=Janibacter sp. G56 TaxID=3418717 RepID=UPI003D082F67
MSQRREILRLAVPAFLTLIAEPLFLLADSAIIGHLGTTSLAGLGVASAVLLTAAGIFVFLAYGTTAVVSRQVGAGSAKGAVEAGVDGTWLAIGLGAAVGLITAAAAGPLCAWLGATGAVHEQAVTYLRISAAGLPAMLVVLAATGVLRGLQDTRTPLVAASLGFGANIVLNLALVHGLHLGIAGSAIGTIIAQWGMAVGLLAVLLRTAAATGASLHPHPGRVLAAALGGFPLLVRTLALRAVLLLTVWVAAGLGDVPLAAYQVSSTIWSFLVFALDAIAIAAQALTGKALGAGDKRAAREATDVMLRWGIGSGIVLGALVLAVHPWLPALFTPDPAVRAAIGAGLVIIALGQPISGIAFVVDGVLMGAGDGRWLAWSMVGLLAAYVPIALALRAAAPTLLEGLDPADAAAVSVRWLWLAFTAFMALRAVVFWWRIRGDAWMVTGARR